MNSNADAAKLGFPLHRAPTQVIFLLVLLFIFIGLSPFLIYTLGWYQFLIFIVACLPSFMLLTYIYNQPNSTFDFFHPLSFVFLSVFLGTTLRSFYIMAFPFTFRSQFLLHGHHTSFLMGSAMYIAFSFGLLLFGYCTHVRGMNLPSYSRLFRKSDWDYGRVKILLGILTVLGVFGMVNFFRKVGLAELTLATFSEKRSTELDAGGFVKVTYSYDRWMASLLQVAFYIAIIYLAKSKKSFKSWFGMLTIFLCLGGMLFPIMTSTRSQALYIIINALVIWYHLRGMPVVFFSISIPLAIGLVYGMLLFRHNAITETGVTEEVGAFGAFESVVGSGNMMCIAKTANIVDAIPTKLEYGYGVPLMAIIFAPIPRAIWHDKPSMVPGDAIRAEVFLEEGATQLGGGNPPAIVAEMFWNFGWFGITLGMIFLGRLMKFYYVTFRPLIKTNSNALLIYMAFLINVSFIMVGSSINQGMLQIITDLIPFFISLFYLNK